MRTVRAYTGQKPTWLVVGAVGLTTCLALTGCGGGAAGEATSESSPQVTVTVTMFDATTLRVVGLIDDRIWALSLNSSRATEAAELDRFRDLIVQLKPRLQD